MPHAISLPFLLQPVNFIPNFTNCLISDLISAWINYTYEQLLSYLENKSLFVTCFVKINEEIIEIRQKTSYIFIVNKLMWDISTTLALFFNEVLESLISDSNECTLAFNSCCNIFL